MYFIIKIYIYALWFCGLDYGIMDKDTNMDIYLKPGFSLVNVHDYYLIYKLIICCGSLLLKVI